MTKVLGPDPVGWSVHS